MSREILEIFLSASSIFLVLNIALFIWLLNLTNETNEAENQCKTNNDIKKGFRCSFWNKEKKKCIGGTYDSNLVCKEFDTRIPSRAWVLLIISIILFLLSIYLYRKK